MSLSQITKIRSPKNTYGWVRAEVLGALVNSVFLLALCFAIVVEAIQRLTTGEAIVSDPDTLLYVGIVGLAFNLAALALFHQAAAHGHSHARRRRKARATRTLFQRRQPENVDDGEYFIMRSELLPLECSRRIISSKLSLFYAFLLLYHSPVRA